VAAVPDTINDLWREFLSHVAPEGGLPQDQYREMRRCFYAGCVAMLSAAGEATDTLPEDDACRQLSAWESELAAFLEGVSEGRF
jgi:hypothetical protein